MYVYSKFLLATLVPLALGQDERRQLLTASKPATRSFHNSGSAATEARKRLQQAFTGDDADARRRLAGYSYSYVARPTAVPTMTPTASAAPTRTETYAPTRMTEAPSYAPTTDTYAPTYGEARFVFTTALRFTRDALPEGYAEDETVLRAIESAVVRAGIASKAENARFVEIRRRRLQDGSVKALVDVTGGSAAAVADAVVGAAVDGSLAGALGDADERLGSALDADATAASAEADTHASTTAPTAAPTGVPSGVPSRAPTGVPTTAAPSPGPTPAPTDFGVCIISDRHFDDDDTALSEGTCLHTWSSPTEGGICALDQHGCPLEDCGENGYDPWCAVTMVDGDYDTWCYCQSSPDPTSLPTATPAPTAYKTPRLHRRSRPPLSRRATQRSSTRPQGCTDARVRH